jgi:hypothetical protein
LTSSIISLGGEAERHFRCNLFPLGKRHSFYADTILISNGFREIDMTTGDATLPNIVSYDGWLTERKKLLVKEKEITHRRDAVNAERRRLPMVQTENVHLSSPGDGPS